MSAVNPVEEPTAETEEIQKSIALHEHDRVYRSIPAPPAGSANWLDLRRMGIGGSEAGAIIGVNPFMSAMDVYMDKLRLIDRAPDTRAMRLGRNMESAIAEEYSEETGVQLFNPGRMYFSRAYPWMLANPDRMIRNTKGEFTKGVELKRSMHPEYWGRSGSDEYPEGYFMQCQHYMLVMGIPVWDLCVLLPGDELRIYEIEENKDIQDDMLCVLGDFWHKNVKAGVPPELDFSSRNILKTVKRLFPAVNDTVIELPEVHALLIEARENVRKEIAELTRQKDIADAQILSLMGEAGKATIHGRYAVTRKEVSRKGYTVAPSTHTELRIKELSA